MIRVTIELLPHGFESRKVTIGVIEIVNDGTGTAQTGNYTYTLAKDTRIAKRPGIWRRGGLTGFPRLKLGVYDLLYRVLRAAVGKRNKENENVKVQEPSKVGATNLRSGGKEALQSPC